MSGIDERYGAFVRSRETVALERLEEIVGINSFTFHREGVNRVGSRVAEWFHALGFQGRTVPSVRPQCGDHLILERPGRGIGSIVMVSHLDTVYAPEEEEQNGFRWRLEGDRIAGPGVADIKGGTIVLLMVLEALAECNGALFDRIHWRVLLNATGEGGCLDFRPLLREAAAGTLAALVYEAGFEQPGGASNVVTTRNGSGGSRVEAFGRAAHSGDAHARRIEVTQESCFPPWPTNGGSDHLAKLAKIVAAQFGFRIEPSHRNDGSDGCHVCDLVPTLDGLGVIGRNLHCSVNDPENGREQESASRFSIVPKTLLSIGLLERIAGR